MAGRRRVGKQRTPWQWLYFEVLHHFAGGALRREISVGRVPLRLDAALIGGAPGPDQGRPMPDILSRLWPCTLIEYKGPNEPLRTGELHHLVGCAWLALGSELSHIPHADVGLHVVAPSMTRAFRDDAARSGATIEEEKPGVHRIDGLAFPCMAFETRIIARDNPALAALDPRTFREPDLVRSLRVDWSEILCYVYDLIRGLDPALEATMTQRDSRTLSEFEKRVRAQMFKDASVEERLESLTPEERLRGVPPEEIVKALTPEQIVKALTPEDRERLRRLLH